MKFTVDWTPAALDELTDLWSAATDRAEVTAASNAIDSRLGRDPASAGESRGGVSRIYFYPPFAVMFDIFEAAGRVQVWAMWRPF